MCRIMGQTASMLSPVATVLGCHSHNNLVGISHQSILDPRFRRSHAIFQSRFQPPNFQYGAPCLKNHDPNPMTSDPSGFKSKIRNPQSKAGNPTINHLLTSINHLRALPPIPTPRACPTRGCNVARKTSSWELNEVNTSSKWKVDRTWRWGMP